MKILRFLAAIFAVLANTAFAEIQTFKQLDRDEDKLLDKSKIEMLVFEIDISSANKDNNGSSKEKEDAKFVDRLRTLKEVIDAPLLEVKSRFTPHVIPVPTDTTDPLLEVKSRFTPHVIQVPTDPLLD